MSNARMALEFCRAISKERFPDDWRNMETLCVDWLASIDAAVDAGSHKYIPAERLNNDLGLPQGAGVYNYRKYVDGSYLLLTCRNGLAIWDGSDKAGEFVDAR
jgi:hypothetical protein